MVKPLRFILLVLACLQALPCRAEPFLEPATQLMYLAEEFKPYSYVENGRQTGLAVEILKLVWKEIQVPEQTILFLPWPRAYAMLKSEKNTVLFSMLRTPEREKLFKWVGPIATSKTFLYAKSTSSISMTSYEDAKGLSVGVVRSYASEDLLTKQSHIINITPLQSVQACIKMLVSGRIDLISLESRTFSKAVQDAGLNSTDFKPVWQVTEMRSYYAFNSDVPDSLITRFQRALDRIRHSRNYTDLVNRYLD
ncbi:ABC transporter substrate-binding protein [uncultured Pseudodesulfovibrio sp.]|uniref:substrate-binding periplasmic protein n=1 Tax=uncultured Pseudodesulfovibrio sp. TaxID=2035858 RepID=UPI0029C65768|nr:ABC transporter substrate-binding protein [uncultured Pseudodesulfovibrio sp.]